MVLNNLNKADTTKVAKGLSPFLKEVLEIWAELNYQDKITSLALIHFLHKAYGIIHSLELWTNLSFIKSGINQEFPAQIKLLRRNPTYFSREQNLNICTISLSAL